MEFFWTFLPFSVKNLLNWVKSYTNPATIVQLDWKNVNFQQIYDHFSLILHHASDHSAKFLTVLAGRTVKISHSQKVPGFESRRLRQKCHWSIWLIKKFFTKWLLTLLLIIFKILNHGQIISKFPIFLCWTKLPHRYFKCLKIRQNLICITSTTKLQNIL